VIIVDRSADTEKPGQKTQPDRGGSTREFHPPPRNIFARIFEYPIVLITGVWWWLRRPSTDDAGSGHKDRPDKKHSAD